MPEEVAKEIAATGEPPPRSVASPEFFFLLQRIDRLDEKLTAEIRALEDRLMVQIRAGDEKLAAEMKAGDEKLAAEIRAGDEKLDQKIEALGDKLDSLRFWAIGAVITLIAGFVGTIITLALRL